MSHHPSPPSSSTGITLSELLGELERFSPRLSGEGAVRVTDVVEDSRRVGPGALFVARAGEKTSAQAFVGEAVSRGASALLIEEGTRETFSVSLPILELPSLRDNLGHVAELVFGRPSTQLSVTGITGTNGKTTVSLLVERALLTAGRQPGRLGTLGSSFRGEAREGQLTTPQADDISRFLEEVRRGGGTHVVMEVSSHALVQRRVAGITFDVAAFTNLTQDHLDFHRTMDAYEEAKRLLFTEYQPRVSVLNVRDQAGHRFAATARSSRVLRVGTPDADVRPVDVVLDARGLRGDVLVAGHRVGLTTRLVGEHNLENVLLALGILEGLGVELEPAVEGWRDFAVPGRLERCDGEEDELVVLVDYAHTPDALMRVLTASRRLTRGRVHCVFGCGGDRDPTKRAKMGAAVAKLADEIIVTNDNPRTESPERIAAAIVEGLDSQGARYRVLLDRARAIREAILGATAGDVVLIAGKGHEPYQILGTTKHPFDDRLEARASLLARRGA